MCESYSDECGYIIEWFILYCLLFPFDKLFI
jgi:hypothetical protein